METRKFLVHYRYNGKDGTHSFTTYGKVNEETFKNLVRSWYNDGDKHLQTIIYSWSLIEE